ncbi:MAG TPA: redoxin family protein [Pirellulaceae bacterium]|nr:redoxin family protein [Pirellulaceae bacterium]
MHRISFFALAVTFTLAALAQAEGTCKVRGSVSSTEYEKLEGKLERSIVWVLADPDRTRLADTASTENKFEFDLKPGNYILQCTGNGSRGATFTPTYKKFTVTEGAETLDLGTIDMPASETTKLFGQPAPELAGIVEWKNTDPRSLKELRGNVVILDFWSYSCSICIHHMPDLAKLVEKHKGEKLVALTLHDNSAASLAEVDGILTVASKKKLGSLPVALDGQGADSVFRAYGIRATPAMILIDAEGNVVRRFHHAGDPQLDKEVTALLRAGR